jgi:hypothetical protein
MSSLAELQSQMTAAIFKGHTADVDHELVAAHADAARRFNIYRNNTFLSLTAHLKAVFPVTAKLGDERFFAYAANEFIRREPPREPRLAVYGAAFPRFLARFPACRGAPILPDMARLEWAVQSALTTGTRAPIGIDALVEIGSQAAQTRLELQPTLGFALSYWPLAGLWASSGEVPIPLERKITRHAVWRQGDSVKVMELSAPRFALWRSLARGFPLELSAGRAIARDGSFDLLAELHNLFEAGIVVTIQPQPNLH